eukprot:jgi/Astpho2/7331/gw1.00113.132.1_t
MCGRPEGGAMRKQLCTGLHLLPHQH